MYNLYPDYAYPGRIVDVKLDVSGEAKEDKLVKIQIRLDTHGDKSFGASKAFLRIADPTGNQTYDAWMTPENDDYSVLSASINISKYSNVGYWRCDTLTLYDEAGNERYSNENNFGWKLYIDNPLADTEKPKFVEIPLKLFRSRRNWKMDILSPMLLLNFRRRTIVCSKVIMAVIAKLIMKMLH